MGTKISGFGGVSGSNSTQFIDFTAVSSGSGVSASYVPAASLTSGTLEVLSGGTIVAEATLVGKYTSATVFDVASGISGSVEIIDEHSAGSDWGNCGAVIGDGIERGCCHHHAQNE